jgi:hypothetical protein
MQPQKIIVAVLAAVLSMPVTAQSPSAPVNPYQAEIDANAQRKAALDAETAAFNAEKARNEARKSALDAEVAAAAARIGVVQGTEQYKGGVTVKDKGTTEAKLLASRAIAELGAKVASKVATQTTKDQRILLVHGTSGPTFHNFVQFDAQVTVVNRALFEANKAATAAEAAADPVLKDAEERRAKAKAKAKPKAKATQDAAMVTAQAAPLALAGAALSSLNNLFSYLRTKYEVGSVDTSLDDSTLVHAVAQSLAPARDVVVPDAYLPTIVAGAGRTSVVDTLLDLATDKAKAVEAASRVTRKAEQLTAFAKEESDAARKAELEKHASALTRSASDLNKASTLFDTFLSKLTTADDKGMSPFALILREQEVYRLLTKSGTKPMVLVVKLQAQGGSYYTKENMWTFLGRMPFFNSGGAAASYLLVDGATGGVKTSGLEYLHTGWMRADEVGKHVQGESVGGAGQQQPAPVSD